ncbi:F420H(2):quinone oxidoreductase [Leptospira hartskeerlii]|uniref:Flavin-containing monooxygenase 5 n=1 Tax=Leptospira hartskeerlii TaxID=2023177 RepID=A0A2M9XDC1_9LEPT|nr:NAD(P)-binding domain-containing protein [Leptospira hartskeerlii]PJZ25696.1 F420H(2):quinone oxidoreductase [Leptospira hartskeerlii]PJZ35481.1 F420H(2):quinone oxidoreductase [Leptospira hartskeerlii]
MTRETVFKKQFTDNSDSYCIIGAGPAGLSMARSFKSKGVSFKVFERYKDVGGIWDMENPGSPMYESAHFISSKYLSGYMNFPMPDNYPDYPSWKQILEYHRNFAKEYNLYEHITFNTGVQNIEQVESGWLVELDNGEQRLFKGIVCASGITWAPNIPQLVGQDSFSGKIIHSVDYRNYSLFQGKRVLIVGAGNSGCDIACDAGTAAEQAFISVRRGYYFIPKHIFGQPADVFGDGAHWIPNGFSQWILAKLLNVLVGNLEKLGLPKPDHKLFETHPIINDQLLHNLRHGDVIAKGEILRINNEFVEFKDGSREKIDLIVLATGYNWSIPYMNEKYFEWRDGRPELYLNLFNRNYENLFAIGYMETDGGAYKMFDDMTNLISCYIVAKSENNYSAKKFEKLIKKDRPLLNGGIRYLDTPRHSVYVNQIAYKKYRTKIQRKLGWPELRAGSFSQLLTK